MHASLLLWLILAACVGQCTAFGMPSPIAVRHGLVPPKISMVRCIERHGSRNISLRLEATLAKGSGGDCRSYCRIRAMFRFPFWRTDQPFCSSPCCTAREPGYAPQRGLGLPRG